MLISFKVCYRFTLLQCSIVHLRRQTNKRLVSHILPLTLCPRLLRPGPSTTKASRAILTYSPALLPWTPGHTVDVWRNQAISSAEWVAQAQECSLRALPITSKDLDWCSESWPSNHAQTFSSVCNLCEFLHPLRLLTDFVMGSSTTSE